VVNGVVVDQATVTEAIKRLWAEQKFECRNVILGITNQQVVVRDLAMPNLSPEQMAKALPYQAREVVPMPMDQALIDWTALGAPDPGTDTIPGLLVATPRQPVLAAVQAVERAGLQVARVDLASFAALRSVADDSVGVQAVVDIGAHITNVVIHSQGIPKVVRAVPRGGDEITERISERMGMSLAEAEAAKREHGLIGVHRELVQTVAEGIRPLLAEIRSSIHYFGSTNGGVQVEAVALTGGGAALRGLAAALTETTQIPSSIATPMQHIRNRHASKEANQQDSDLAATAVSLGLAMGAAA
jgi:type IV pilus assembly protein PilM